MSGIDPMAKRLHINKMPTAQKLQEPLLCWEPVNAKSRWPNHKTPD